MLASEEGHTQVLRLLHEKGADRKLTTTVSVHQVQLDHHSSCLFACLFVTRRYCCLVCSCVVCEQDGRTALSFAAKGAFERALAAGQDVNRRFEAHVNKHSSAHVDSRNFELEVTAVGKYITPVFVDVD